MQYLPICKTVPSGQLGARAGVREVLVDLCKQLKSAINQRVNFGTVH